MVVLLGFFLFFDVLFVFVIFREFSKVGNCLSFFALLVIGFLVVLVFLGLYFLGFCGLDDGDGSWEGFCDDLFNERVIVVCRFRVFFL